MPHFTLTRVDGWPNGSGISKANLESLDAKVFASVNGDRGGCWTPSAAITLDSTNGGALHLTGPLVLSSGGVAGSGKLTTSGTATIGVAWSDYPRLGATHKDRSRDYAHSLLLASGYPMFGVRPHLPYRALQAVAASFKQSNGSITPNTWRALLRVSDKSTLSRVAVTFRSLMGSPLMRIERVDDYGTATPLTSTAAGADANGFIRATPSITAKDANGLPSINTAIIPVDGGAAPANAIVSHQFYRYYLRVVEDQTLTPAFPNRLPVATWCRVATTGANLSLTGAATIDGFAVSTGDHVLVKDQTDPTKNGIYIANTAGAWSYSSDSPSVTNTFFSGSFPAGLVVPVRFGNANKNTIWQLQQQDATAFSSGMTYGSIPANPIGASGAFLARGNLYYAATVTMTQIADDRFQ